MKYLVFVLMCSFQLVASEPTPTPKPERTPETREERRARMREKMREEMRSQMQESKRILEQFLSDDMFSSMRQQFKQMMEQMEKGSLDSYDQFFDDKVLERLFRGQRGNAFGALGSGQSRWIETPQERTLVLKLEVAKDQPIDFKIEGSRLTIATEVERKIGGGVSRQSFTRVFEIPSDCDPSKAKFENKDGEILIRFPKFAERSKRDGKRPVKPDASDDII